MNLILNIFRIISQDAVLAVRARVPVRYFSHAKSGYALVFFALVATNKIYYIMVIEMVFIWRQLFFVRFEVY